MTKPIDLDQLLKLAREATKGPWVNGEFLNFRHSQVVDSSPDQNGICSVFAIGNTSNPNSMMIQALINQEYIASVDPTTITELIARLKDAERLIEIAVDKDLIIYKEYEKRWKK